MDYTNLCKDNSGKRSKVGIVGATRGYGYTLLAQIPTCTDEAKLVELYTELNRIWLTEVPSFALMYRPAVFYAVNESVWTNYPSADDGRNIPPSDCTDGYGIRALYELELVG